MAHQRKEQRDGAVMPPSNSQIRRSSAKVAPPKRKLDRRVLLLLVAVFLAQVLWNIRPTVAEGSYTQAEEIEDLRLRMFLTASTVNAYHDSAGRFPPSLVAMDADEDGITYSADEIGYVLVGVAAGTTIEYFSADDINTLPPGRGLVLGEAAP